jgi:hypothetical protein
MSKKSGLKILLSSKAWQSVTWQMCWYGGSATIIF